MNMLSVLMFLPNLGGSELLLILFIVLLFFGARKLPELARGLGKGIREFKDATSGVKNSLEESLKEEEKNKEEKK